MELPRAPPPPASRRACGAMRGISMFASVQTRSGGLRSPPSDGRSHPTNDLLPRGIISPSPDTMTVQMKIFTRAAFVLGLAAFCVLVLRNDVQSIAGLLRQAGWLLLCLIPLHCVPLGLDVMGWRVLVLERTEVATLFVIASIREAINRLLPVANVGGEVVGARLLVRRGVSYAAAVSSILVETILNILSQVLFLTL